MKNEHVARTVIRGGPAALTLAEHARAQGRAEMPPRTYSKAAQLDRTLHQRHPGRQHVLNAGYGIILVHVPAAGHSWRALRIDGAQDLCRVGEGPWPENHPDEAAQPGEVRDLVEGWARDGGAERRVIQCLSRVERPPAARRNVTVVHPAAPGQFSEDAIGGRAPSRRGGHAAGGRAVSGGGHRGAEEEVSVVPEAAAQRVRLTLERTEIRQLVHAAHH